MDLIIFFVALSVLVFFHEFGHFLMARKNGVRVEEFGLGLPPRAWGKKIGETIYSLNWLPIGGFCKLYGEELKEVKGKENDRDKSFVYKKPWQKAVILIGGVFMNLVVAIVIFSIVFYVLGIPTEIGKVKINQVASGSPAEEVGLVSGDYITSVEGVKLEKVGDLIDQLAKYKGKGVEIGVEKNTGEVERVMILVRENPPEGEGSLGVVVSSIDNQKFPLWQAYRGVWQGFKEAYFWGKVIIDGLVQMVGGLIKGQVPEDVAGPVGMYQATSAVRKDEGILGVLHFFGIISVNLAVVNLLPFPALDGGRLVFVLIEKIRGKRVNEKIEATANAIGMSLLLGLILLVTIGDVVRLLK